MEKVTRLWPHRVKAVLRKAAKFKVPHSWKTISSKGDFDEWLSSSPLNIIDDIPEPCICDALSQLARESGDEVENVYCLVCGKGVDDKYKNRNAGGRE